jgi:hypothetical protein
MQVAVFVLKGIIPDEQLFVWELLSEVKHMMILALGNQYYNYMKNTS